MTLQIIIGVFVRYGESLQWYKTIKYALIERNFKLNIQQYDDNKHYNRLVWVIL